MEIVTRFLRFWVDFIVGDALEVALVVFITLALLGTLANTWSHSAVLGFVLLAAVIAVSWVALLRATASARR